MKEVTFQRLIEDAGYEPRSYSGRGMYGASCLGVVVQDVGKFVGDVLHEIADHIDTDDCGALELCEPISDAFRGMSMDNMGRDIIVYFPHTEFNSNGDEDEGVEDEV